MSADVPPKPPATGVPAPRSARVLRTLAKAVVLLLVVPALLVAVYVWGALHFAYSDGERAGYVQKLSRKGWVCKTWEGELAMVSLPGSMPEIFSFTVRDDTVAARLNQTMGQRVAIHYEQHRGLPTSCWGETEYFVTDVKLVPQ